MKDEITYHQALQEMRQEKKILADESVSLQEEIQIPGNVKYVATYKIFYFKFPSKITFIV